MPGMAKTHVGRGSAERAVGLVLAFAFLLAKTEAIVGAVEKWESRALSEISKGGWEPVKTCFWFSPDSMLPPFPRRGLGFVLISFSPVRL